MKQFKGNGYLLIEDKLTYFQGSFLSDKYPKT